MQSENVTSVGCERIIIVFVLQIPVKIQPNFSLLTVAMIECNMPTELLAVFL